MQVLRGLLQGCSGTAHQGCKNSKRGWSATVSLLWEPAFVETWVGADTERDAVDTERDAALRVVAKPGASIPTPAFAGLTGRMGSLV